jgi:hypothetical protein
MDRIDTVQLGAMVLMPGYYVMAIVACANGGEGKPKDVVIMHNNSSHYLVGVRMDPDSDYMQVKWIQPYDDVIDDPSSSTVYAQALAMMLYLVLIN